MNAVLTPSQATPMQPFASLRAPLPLARVFGAYLAETRYELLGALRTVGYAIPFIVVPVAIYILFGVVINGNADSQYGPGIANYLFCGFAVLAVIMPGIFSSVILATERDCKLVKLKRAQPMPPGAAIVAKVLMSMAIAAMAVTLVVIAAVATSTTNLTAAQIAIVWIVLVLGSIPFSAMGLWIGTLTSASAAPAWANLVFLPMMWLSGLFIPLPAFLQQWVVIWPAFHLDQLALGLAGVKGFIFIPTATAAVVLIGVTLLFGGLAIRRLTRVG